MTSGLLSTQNPSREIGLRPNEPPPRSRGLSHDDFEIFARDYGERLRLIALRMLRSPDDAADAVQDALLSAYSARHAFHGQATVYTWLHRIVVNACLMKLRGARRRNNRCRPVGSTAGENLVDVADVALEPDNEGLEREEMRAELRARLNLLSTDFQTVLRLRYFDQLNIREIAQHLKLSSEAVKTRLHRARCALRAAVEIQPSTARPVMDRGLNCR